QLVPVLGHVAEQPGFAGNGLGADLLGQGHAVGFQHAVRVVRGQAHQQATLMVEHKHFGLAGRARTDNLDVGILDHLVGGDAVVQRHGAWAGHAQFGQLFNVVLDGSQVAASPAGHDAMLQISFDDFSVSGLGQFKSQTHSSTRLLKDRWGLTEQAWQPQSQIWEDSQQAHHGQQHDHKGQAANHDVVHAAALAQALDHKQVQTNRRSDQRHFHQNNDGNTQPHRVKAQGNHDGGHDGDGGDHHGQGFHEAAQHQVEHHDDHQHDHGLDTQASDGVGQRIGQAGSRHHEVQEGRTDHDQHDHGGGFHGAFQYFLDHRPVHAARESGQQQRTDHTQGSRFGRGGNTGVNRTDHQQENTQWWNQVHQAGKTLAPGCLDLGAAPFGLDHTCDSNRQHEQQGHAQTGDNAGQVQLGHGGVGQHAVDHQVDRRWNQNAQGTASGQTAQEQGLVIALLLDLRQGYGTDGGGGGHAGAGCSGKQGAGTDIGVHQAAGQPGQPQAHGVVHAFSHARAQQDFAQHDEQGDSDQQEFVAGAPGNFTQCASQRQHGIQRVQNQAQNAQGSAHGNAQSDQNEQESQCSTNHLVSPWTMRWPASASSRASSWVLRMPHRFWMAFRSPVIRARLERSSISARTTHSQIRPATHRNWGIHRGVPIAVFAVDWL